MKTILGGFCLALILGSQVQAREVHSESGAISVEVLVKSVKSWDGSELEAYAPGKPQISILKITIAPNTSLPMHQHPFINAGLLLKGELTVVTQEGETLYMKTGDTIIEVVDKWHHGMNESEEPAEIVVFYAGIEGQPITLNKDQE
jgi:quercetin dioxygenase-like cupin family protein